MRRMFAIIERDLRKFLRNPLVMAVSIVMPIIYLLILGNSFLGELKHLPIAVIDRDGGVYAERVLKNLEAIERGPSTIAIYRISSEGEAMRGLKEGVFKAVVILPQGFSKHLVKRGSTEVGLFIDNSDVVSANTLRTALLSALGSVERDFIAVRERTHGVRVRTVEVHPKIDYDQTLIPGVVIMAIFLGALTTGVFNIVMDRFLGTDESILLTPLTKTDIVGGLVVSGLIITTVLALVVLGLSSLISGIYLWKTLTLGGFIGVVFIVMLSTLSLQGLLFIILGRADHPRVVGVLGGFLNVILFFPSGAVYPVESFPYLLRLFALVNPETYSVHALKTVLFKGAGLNAIKGDILFLAVFALVSIAIATLTFKREL